MRKTLAALALSLLTILALPLAAADLPAEVSTIDNQSTEPAQCAEPVTAALELASCSMFECRDHCLRLWGEGVQWNCEGGWGEWFNSYCVCYP